MLCAFGIQMKTAAAQSDSLSESKSASELHAEGLRFFSNKKFREAIAMWLRELELDPTNPNTLNNIGIAFSKIGELFFFATYPFKPTDF